MIKENRFYNREKKNSAAFCVIQQMSNKPSFPSMQHK